MGVYDKPAKNGFVRAARKVYNPLGFSKGYNALLCLIFNGAFLGFVLARFEFLNFNNIFCSPGGDATDHAAPGECYWFQTIPRNNIGIMLHLATILPAGLLAVFQFIPAIRHKAILYHKMAGYVIILLVLVSNAGTLMMANHAFGGDSSTRMWIGTMVILVTLSLALAYYNIKRLQIDQHRAWMLRAWFYLGTIVTLRIIQISAANIAPVSGGDAVYVVRPCDEIVNIFGGSTDAAYYYYPACAPNVMASSGLGGYVPVLANFNSPDPVQISAALASWFSPAGWLALVLHAVGVEVYLNLTPRESQRLRQVSYERQLACGMKHAGSAGLVHDRLGDADSWVPSNTSSSALHPPNYAGNERQVGYENGFELGQSKHSAFREA